MILSSPQKVLSFSSQLLNEGGASKCKKSKFREMKGLLTNEHMDSTDGQTILVLQLLENSNVSYNIIPSKPRPDNTQAENTPQDDAPLPVYSHK